MLAVHIENSLALAPFFELAPTTLLQKTPRIMTGARTTWLQAMLQFYVWHRAPTFARFQLRQASSLSTATTPVCAIEVMETAKATKGRVIIGAGIVRFAGEVATATGIAWPDPCH